MGKIDPYGAEIHSVAQGDIKIKPTDPAKQNCLLINYLSRHI